MITVCNLLVLDVAYLRMPVQGSGEGLQVSCWLCANLEGLCEVGQWPHPSVSYSHWERPILVLLVWFFCSLRTTYSFTIGKQLQEICEREHALKKINLYPTKYKSPHSKYEFACSKVPCKLGYTVLQYCRNIFGEKSLLKFCT